MNEKSLILVCSACKTKNRIPISRINDVPKCGKCGEPLDISILAKPVDITDITFDGEVLASSLPVLVDCWAPWCGPCKAVGPVLDELAAVYKGKVKIAKLNVDNNPQVSSRYSISSIPTMLLVKDGKIIHTLVGAQPKEEIERQLKMHLFG